MLLRAISGRYSALWVRCSHNDKKERHVRVPFQEYSRSGYLYRRIVRNAFTPKTVQGYEARFREVARETIDTVAAKGDCEFVADVAALAEKHKTEPLTDIVGALLDGTVNDEKLTADEFQLFFLMSIAAGNESTRSVIAHGMRLLIEHPEQLRKLVEDPTLIPYAVEEVLRYNPAFLQMRRTVMADVELQGQQLRTGDKMVLNWHAINHDPEIFANPAPAKSAFRGTGRVCAGPLCQQYQSDAAAV